MACSNGVATLWHIFYLNETQSVNYGGGTESLCILYLVSFLSDFNFNTLKYFVMFCSIQHYLLKCISICRFILLLYPSKYHEMFCFTLKYICPLPMGQVYLKLLGRLHQTHLAILPVKQRGYMYNT